MRRPEASILVVDDHVEMARLLADQLRDAGYEVTLASSGREALSAAQERLPDLVIADLRMEGVDGLDVLAGIQRLGPSLPVLIMTAFGSIDTAIEAMKRGAYHYFTKPFQLREVLIYVQRALEERRLRERNRSLERLVAERAGLGALVGKSPAMRALFELIERVAPSSVPILVRGESGTGKELVARSVHVGSERRSGPFVAVNCTSIPEALLESELFGHVKGAFTGATAARRGLFLEADGGTLFLDEIGDMPLPLQAKLLRVLEDGEVRAVGGDGVRKVDTRIVAATHHDLEARMRDGRFRSDLFFRLNVVPIHVPPLRERPDDIPLLVEHFLTRAREANPSSAVHRITGEALAFLARRPWPGNVRELENLVKRLAIVVTTDTVSLRDVEAHAGAAGASFDLERRDAIVPLRQLEDEYIAHVIRRCEGNKTRAAELLGIDVSTIHRREKAAT